MKFFYTFLLLSQYLIVSKILPPLYFGVKNRVKKVNIKELTAKK
jgi:hypothetical protein